MASMASAPGSSARSGSQRFHRRRRKGAARAARAQHATGVPLEVHLPGWERHGERVLDVVAEEGGDLRRTVLCHMNPSGHDFDYQVRLAERGAWLEYDMIGMDYFYADQQAQSPSDEENARALLRLRDAELLGSVLISQDIFIKIQLVRYGGTGYAHILDHFACRGCVATASQARHRDAVGRQSAPGLRRRRLTCHSHRRVGCQKTLLLAKSEEVTPRLADHDFTTHDFREGGRESASRGDGRAAARACPSPQREPVLHRLGRAFPGR